MIRNLSIKWMYSAGLLLLLAAWGVMDSQVLAQSTPRYQPYRGVLPISPAGSTRGVSQSGAALHFGFLHSRRHHHHRHFRTYYPYDHSYNWPYRYRNSRYSQPAVDPQSFKAGRSQVVDYRVPIEQRVAEELAPEKTDSNEITHPLILARKRLADGWSTLSESKLDEAKEAFAKAAQASSTQASARVGQALVVAQQGDLSQAVTPMRQAVRLDPRVLHKIELNAPLRRQVEQLRGRYEETLTLNHSDVDAAFMTTALAYMLNDLERAWEASALAVEDQTASTRQLRRLIQIRLPDQVEDAESDPPLHTNHTTSSQ